MIVASQHQFNISGNVLIPVLVKRYEKMDTTHVCTLNMEPQSQSLAQFNLAVAVGFPNSVDANSDVFMPSRKNGKDGSHFHSKNSGVFMQ